MKKLREYCGIQEGATITSEEVVILEISKPGTYGCKKRIASMFIYPASADDNNDDRVDVMCCGYIWKMGKAEYHYRKHMKDKHARRWIKRHSKAVRL